MGSQTGEVACTRPGSDPKAHALAPAPSRLQNWSSSTSRPGNPVLLEQSDGKAPEARIRGLPAQGVAPHKHSNYEQLPGLGCTLPAAQMRRLKAAGTPCTPGRGPGLGLREGGDEGPRSRPGILCSSHRPHPTPLQPTRAPGPEGAPPPRSRRAQSEPQFRPAHRRPTARARRAPAEPLRGSLFDSSLPDIPAAPPRAPRAQRPAPGGRLREGVLRARAALYLQDIRRG